MPVADDMPYDLPPRHGLCWKATQKQADFSRMRKLIRKIPTCI